jgi:hypothetical protein
VEGSSPVLIGRPKVPGGADGGEEKQPLIREGQVWSGVYTHDGAEQGARLDVVRTTEKTFQGQWQGSARLTLEAEITASRADERSLDLKFYDGNKLYSQGKGKVKGKKLTGDYKLVEGGKGGTIDLELKEDPKGGRRPAIRIQTIIEVNQVWKGSGTHVRNGNKALHDHQIKITSVKEDSFEAEWYQDKKNTGMIRVKFKHVKEDEWSFTYEGWEGTGPVFVRGSGTLKGATFEGTYVNTTPGHDGDFRMTLVK